MGSPGLHHKFVGAMETVYPHAKLYRKSGTYAHWHSDSAIVERNGRTYIAVAVMDDAQGSGWMGKIILAMDKVIFTPASMKEDVASGLSRTTD